MKYNIKNLSLLTMTGLVSFGTVSCDDLLDMEPVSQITPDGYYVNASQIEAYVNNYYDSYITGPYASMYHQIAWNDGMIQSDANTDILVLGLTGNTSLFAKDHWDTPSGKQLQDYYGNVRTMNFLINKVNENIEKGKLSLNDAAVKNAIGEAYFLRAMVYYRILVLFGDAPIVTEVLENSDEAILPASVRNPRNEVADFILQDMDKAIAYLKDRSASNGQRLNKQAAQVFAGRVALFEATFEKYHKGSGRVPGDSNWPGAKMSYNSGKSFDIDSHVKSLLNKVLEYSKPVADAANLSDNSHVISPAENSIYSWNAYFEMFSQPSLNDCNEVLLWKEYNTTFGISHDVPYRSMVGCQDGYTRNFVQSFLCKDGKPIYASGLYKGDVSYADVMANRDERLQLFVWSDQRKRNEEMFVIPAIVASNQQTRSITGYQSRKYYTYDPNQTPDDNKQGTNACPIFRTTEAMLNYMEASAELNNGQPDGNAINYWKQLRIRAGVNDDVAATVAATDLDKEYDGGNGDFGVYSGTSKINAWLYNVRRERLNEMFSEGIRRTDLVRWRAYDNMLKTPWIPEGVNFWNGINSLLADNLGPNESITSDGSTDATVSAKSLSDYLRPYSVNMSSTNELREGLVWTEAYYLYPIGVEDLTSSSADRSVETSMLYQNINWSTRAGSHAEK